MAYAIILNMCDTFWICNVVIFRHVCHDSTNSDTRALWHDSLWLKIREEFNISALIDYSLLVWQDHEQDFPIISCMTRDFSAIPGVSISVKRLFLKSMHLCSTDLWGLLKAATIMDICRNTVIISVICIFWISFLIFSYHHF